MFTTRGREHNNKTKFDKTIYHDENEKLHHDARAQRLLNITMNVKRTMKVVSWELGMISYRKWKALSWQRDAKISRLKSSRQKNYLMLATVIKSMVEILFVILSQYFHMLTSGVRLTFLTDREMFSNMRSFTFSWSISAILTTYNRLSADSLIRVP